jgi:membrane-bound serine protease (ClpP class)
MAFMESIAKERNRNVEWALSAVREAEAIPQDRALELGVIDLVARNRADLLEQLEGMEVTVDGETSVLEIAGAEIRVIEMTAMTRLFNFLASPDVALLLGMAGLFGLYMEFQNPGMLIPGIVGALCLILAGFAFQILPFSWLGLVVLLVGVGLLVAEVFAPAFGALFALGIIFMLVGGTMIFDLPDVSDLTVSFWSVLVPVVASFSVAFGLVVILVTRSFFRPQTAGVDELLGLVGESKSALELNGKVFVRGEYWDAQADQPIASGERIEVTAVEGMRLRVRRVEAGSSQD